MKKLLFFMMVFLWHTGAQSADGFSTLEERMSGIENPEVVIKKGFMNKWKLSLVGHKAKVAVKRIQ